MRGGSDGQGRSSGVGGSNGALSRKQVSIRIRRVRRSTCSDAFMFFIYQSCVTCGRGYATL